jgi:proline racemase
MGIRYRRVVQTVDSHTEGNATRVIVGGVKTPPGATLLDKRAWLWRNDDGLRRMLNFEPRGSGMMCSVLLLPAERPGSDFAVIIMEQDEYVPMCGHCIIGTATTVVATGMVPLAEPVTTVRFDTPAGLVVCDVAVEGGSVGAVSFNNVDSFLLHRGRGLDVEGIGRITVDIAYGGDFYTFVDADPIGLALEPGNDAALIDAWRRIARAVAEQIPTVHPERPDINACYQVLFTSRHTTTGDAKQTILCPPGSIDRSPCGTGTSARVALMHTLGQLPFGERRRFEGVLGTCFAGEAVAASRRGDILYVTPRVTGSAYLTGFHQFVLDPADPLPEGFRIGPTPRREPRLPGMP